MNTTLVGIRLQDETGADFLVISVPPGSLATPDAAGDTLMAFSSFEFPHVFASRRADGKWIYVGLDSLTAICESKLGQNPEWQEIRVLPKA